MDRTNSTPLLHSAADGSPLTAPPALLGVLRDHAVARPDAGAIITEGDGQAISYAELLSAVERIARQLRGAGVATGDVVIAQVENDWTVLALLLASSLNGSVFVPLSGEVQADTMRQIERETEPKLALYSGERPGAGLTGTVTMHVRDLLAAEPDAQPVPPVEHAATDPLLIIYTSGTTGIPKGVVLSESNLVTDAAGIGVTYAIAPGDRMLCVMPLYHMNGVMITGLVPLIAGATTVLAGQFRFQAARTYLQKIDSHGITVLSVIPSIMAVLTRISAPVDLSAKGVRLALCGTAPLPAPLWRQFEQHFGVPVYQGYGLTETTCWATMTPPESPHGHDGVGRPVNCEVRIDSATPGEAGEVMIRGPIVLLRYQARESPLEDGWFRTGDIGYFDDHGQLIISGRIKDTIIRYGMNVHPSEIDRVMVRFPGVAESATVGLPDSIAGETVHTAWVAKPDAAPAEKALREFLAQHVARSALPDRLHQVQRLPTNAIGKVERKVLRELLSGEPAGGTVDA